MTILFIYAALFVIGYMIGHEYARFKMESSYLEGKKGLESKVNQLESELALAEKKLLEAKTLFDLEKDFKK